jgi:antitoxin YefM
MLYMSRERVRVPRQATYTYVRENLARLLEEVEEQRDVVIINRRGHEDVALVPAGELESLVETAHLLRSPKNAARLLAALRRALARKGKAQTVEQLRAELGLGVVAGRRR